MLRALATAVATLSGNIFLLLGSLLFASLAILGRLIAGRAEGSYPFARAWARGLLVASGVRLEVTSGEPLDPRTCHVFMANHQSLFDIPVLLATLPGRTLFLAKESLFRIPLFGPAMRAAGFIPVDRENRAQAREMFALAVASLERGTSLLVFPEETRSPGGELLPFQRGGFLLSIKAGRPIVPVGLAGTRRVRRRGSLVIRPGRVRVRYGAPVAPPEEGVRGKAELMARVRHEIGRLAGVDPVQRRPGVGHY